MSVEHLLAWLGLHKMWLAGYFVINPVLIIFLGLKYNKGPSLQWRDHIISTFIYLVAIPGIFSAIMLFYAMFFLHQNLLKVDAVLYFLPWISMLVSFFLANRYADIERLPGFGRLSGLMLMLSIIGICMLVLYRMQFMMMFFSSLQSLIIIAIVLFFILKLAAKKVFGKK